MAREMENSSHLATVTKNRQVQLSTSTVTASNKATII